MSGGETGSTSRAFGFATTFCLTMSGFIVAAAVVMASLWRWSQLACRYRFYLFPRVAVRCMLTLQQGTSANSAPTAADDEGPYAR